VLAEEETAEAEERGSGHARTRQAGAAGRKTMRRPAGSVLAAALAIFFGALVLMSLVVDGGKNPAIGGRKMMTRADGERRASEDVKAGDPFQDSKRRVPNGPDPIHNRYYNLRVSYNASCDIWFLAMVSFPTCHSCLPLQKRSCCLSRNLKFLA
jgi:hypothetical protein